MEEETREYLGDWYDIAGPALGLAEPAARQADPQGVCDGLVAAVNRLVRRAWPLVLLIDDLHWADQETLQWLSALADRLTEMCVLVVVAYRPGEASGERAEHLARIAAKARPVTTLSALTPGATAGLTRATVGLHADDPFCREVWAVTGGNAYNTVELLAKVKDSGLEPVEDSAAELRALNRSARGHGLVARLEELGVEATRFAWAAAILHTGITVDIVARLASLPRSKAKLCAELLTSARILTEPWRTGGFVLWAFIATFAYMTMVTLAFWPMVGLRLACTAGYAAGSRNNALLLAALPAAVDPDYFLFIAAVQFPIYLIPTLTQPIYRRLLPHGR
jgi:hypothetical protein